MAEFDWIPKRLTQEAYKRLGSAQLEEIRRRLHGRHQNDELTAVEASIYCGVSTRTIKRAIDAGKGPDRRKNIDVTGNQAINRHTKYRKSDLDGWKFNQLGFDAFTGRFNAFDDLVNEEPWVMDGSRIAGHLFDVGGIEEVMDILASGEVEFFRLDEALRERWVSVDLRNLYEKQFRVAVEITMEEIDSARHRDVQDVETPAVSREGGRRGL